MAGSGRPARRRRWSCCIGTGPGQRDHLPWPSQGRPSGRRTGRSSTGIDLLRPAHGACPGNQRLIAMRLAGWMGLDDDAARGLLHGAAGQCRPPSRCARAGQRSGDDIDQSLHKTMIDQKAAAGQHHSGASARVIRRRTGFGSGRSSRRQASRSRSDDRAARGHSRLLRLSCLSDEVQNAIAASYQRWADRGGPASCAATRYRWRRGRQLARAWRWRIASGARTPRGDGPQAPRVAVRPGSADLIRADKSRDPWRPRHRPDVAGGDRRRAVLSMNTVGLSNSMRAAGSRELRGPEVAVHVGQRQRTVCEVAGHRRGTLGWDDG